MLAAMLLLVSTASSPAASAAGLSGSVVFAGVLAAEGDAPQSDAPKADAPAELSIDQMTRAQLRAEYRRLDDERPGLGAPITLIAVGGGIAVVSALVEAYGLLFALISKVPAALFIAAGCTLVGGGVLLAVGIVVLLRSRGERAQYSDRMEDINKRLERLDAGERNRDDYIAPPPPPPLPPPSAGLAAPPAALVVARF